jgi:hypothetical protein
VIYLLKIVIMALFLTALTLEAFHVPLGLALPVGAAIGLFVGLVMGGKK